MLLSAALLCGVASTPEVTSLYRRWKRGYASHIEHPEETWELTTWSIRGGSTPGPCSSRPER